MKQIEEIRKDIFAAFGGYAKWEEDWESLAEAVYNAGYRKASDVAEEIFAEIHQRLDSNIECHEITAILTNSKRAKEDYEIAKRTLIDVRHYIAELRKKYTEEQNDTQRKGEWLYHKTLKIGGGLGVTYKCSVCGKVTGFTTDYCSKCGSNMKREKE